MIFNDHSSQSKMLHFPTASANKNSERHVSLSPISVEDSFLVPKQNQINENEKKHFHYSSLKETTEEIKATPPHPPESPEQYLEQTEPKTVEPVQITKSDVIPTQNLSEVTLFLKAIKNEKDEHDKIMKSVNQIALNPQALRFIPYEQWAEIPSVDLSNLTTYYFQKRSSKKLRFEYKLWNALIITKCFPNLFPFVGVKWETIKIIKVDVNVFAKLLGISKATSALCSPQGSFPSHGFTEVLEKKYKEISLTETENIRFYKHESGKFRSDSTMRDLDQCKWNSKNKNASHTLNDDYIP